MECSPWFSVTDGTSLKVVASWTRPRDDVSLEGAELSLCLLLKVPAGETAFLLELLPLAHLVCLDQPAELGSILTHVDC